MMTTIYSPYNAKNEENCSAHNEIFAHRARQKINCTSWHLHYVRGAIQKSYIEQNGHFGTDNRQLNDDVGGSIAPVFGV